MLGILQDNLLPLPDNYKMEKSKWLQSRPEIQGTHQTNIVYDPCCLVTDSNMLFVCFQINCGCILSF